MNTNDNSLEKVFHPGLDREVVTSILLQQQADRVLVGWMLNPVCGQLCVANVRQATQVPGLQLKVMTGMGDPNLTYREFSWYLPPWFEEDLPGLPDDPLIRGICNRLRDRLITAMETEK